MDVLKRQAKADRSVVIKSISAKKTILSLDNIHTNKQLYEHYFKDAKESPNILIHSITFKRLKKDDIPLQCVPGDMLEEIPAIEEKEETPHHYVLTLPNGPPIPVTLSADRSVAFLYAQCSEWCEQRDDGSPRPFELYQQNQLAQLFKNGFFNGTKVKTGDQFELRYV